MRLHGSHGQLEIGDSPMTLVASINKWSLNMTRDRVDVTCFGDTNKEYVQGLPDIKGTFGGFYDPGDGSPAYSSPLSGGNVSAIFDAAEGDVPVTLRLTPCSLEASHYWEGLAYLDASVDIAANGAIAISGSFAGAGPWTRA